MHCQRIREVGVPKELIVLARGRSIPYQCNKKELVRRLAASAAGSGTPSPKGARGSVAPASSSEDEDEDDEPSLWTCDGCQTLLRATQVSYSCQAKACEHDLCTRCWREDVQEEHLRTRGAKHCYFTAAGGVNDGVEFEVTLDPESDSEGDSDGTDSDGEEVAAAFQKLDTKLTPTKKPDAPCRKPTSLAPSKLAALTLLIKSRPCGLALLIGNSAYRSDKYAKLPRCVRDVARMKEALESLGFLVNTRVNLTADEIKRELFDFHLDARHKQAQICALYFSGHGNLLNNGSDTLVGVDGKEHKVEAVLHQFNPDSCDALAGKPKLIMLDSCRGSEQELVAKAPRPQNKYNTKGVSGSGGAHVEWARSANWWHLTPVFKGSTAGAVHPHSKLSPFTHHLAPALEGLRGGDYDLNFVHTVVAHSVQQDMQDGLIDAMSPNVTNGLTKVVKFQ